MSNDEMNAAIRSRTGRAGAVTATRAGNDLGAQIAAATAELQRAQAAGDDLRADHASRGIDLLLDEARLDHRDRLTAAESPPPNFDAGVRQTPTSEPSMTDRIRHDVRGY